MKCGQANNKEKDRTRDTTTVHGIILVYLTISEQSYYIKQSPEICEIETEREKEDIYNNSCYNCRGHLVACSLACLFAC